MIGRSLASAGLALVAVCAALTAAPTAWAQSAADKAAAEALFQQARELMKDGKYDPACEKFAASQRLDPGVGTLLFLGDCQEKAQRFASAWAAFQRAAELAAERKDERQEIAEVRAAALRPRAPKLSLRVNDANTMAGFRLLLNGKPVAPDNYREPTPVDAGDYSLEANAPGHEAWMLTITLVNGNPEPYVVEVPELVSAAPAPVAPPEPSPAAPSLPTDSDPALERPPADGSSQRTLGLIVGGAGIAIGIVSGVFTALAAGKNSDSEAECRQSDPTRCNPDGVTLRDDAKNLASIATVTGIAGGVAIATGAVLYLTAPSPAQGQAVGAQIGIRGQF